MSLEAHLRVEKELNKLYLEGEERLKVWKEEEEEEGAKKFPLSSSLSLSLSKEISTRHILLSYQSKLTRRVERVSEWRLYYYYYCLG
jgi:hypothetical protein